jgi:uncharacterized protein YcbX
MLGRKRLLEQGLIFGQNFIPDLSAVIRLGDEVEVLDRIG